MVEVHTIHRQLFGIFQEVYLCSGWCHPPWQSRWNKVNREGHFSRDVFWPRPETRKSKKSKWDRFTFIASKPQEPGLGDAFHRLPWVHPFWAGMVFREIERALIFSTATASLLKTDSENKRFKLHTNHCQAGGTAGRRHSRCLETQRPSEEIHYLPLAPNIHCLLFE